MCAPGKRKGAVGRMCKFFCSSYSNHAVVFQVSLVVQAKAFSSDARARTTVLINLAAVMERTDEQMLPAVYAFVACSFNATLTQLGNITLCRALVQAIASPLGGFLGAYLWCRGSYAGSLGVLLSLGHSDITVVGGGGHFLGNTVFMQG